MGLFDFFRKPPTPERFAERFLKEMRRAGVNEPLTYDRDNDRILVGTGDQQRVINLTNFYMEHLSLPAWRRGRHLRDRARLNVQLGDHTMAENFDEARGHLRPKLWVRAALESMRLQVELDGGDPSKLEIPEYAVGSHLSASLVYDLPDAMMSVSGENLRDWGVTYYEALEIARENLEITPFHYAAIGRSCYAFMTGDSYDACRLLVSRCFDKIEVDGDLVAMVPNRDSLLIAGADDVDGLKIMIDLAEEALKQPRPMVPIPLCRDGDDWVDWLPPPGHPLAARFRYLQQQFLAEIYGQQTELLQRLHERQGVDIFVASYLAVQKPDGSTFSLACWVDGVLTLLPKADWISFGRGQNEEIARAPWEKVEQVVGQLLQPTEHYPQRFRIEAFPSEAELAALGKAEP